MADQMPASPLTELAAGAAQMHELYTAYVAAGFSATQAMQLICAMLTAIVQAAAQGPKSE